MLKMTWKQFKKKFFHHKEKFVSIEKSNSGSVQKSIQLTQLQTPSSINSINNPENNSVDNQVSQESNYDTHFLNAVRASDIRDVIWFLKNGAKVNACDKDNNTALHLAIRFDDGRISNEKIINQLIAAGADVNAVNKDGDTPLHLVFKPGVRKLANIKRLVSIKEININIINSTGNTPLYSAVNYGDLEILELLLKAGAVLNIENNSKNTLLKKAVYTGNIEIVELLQKFGLKIDPSIQLAGRLMMHSIQHGKVEMIEFLLKQGINANLKYEDEEAIFLHLIKEILHSFDRHFSQINSNDLKVYLKVAHLLLTYGADINARTSTSNETALMLVTRYADNFTMSKFAEIKLLSEFLLNARIDINARDSQFYSVFKTKNTILKQLIEKKEKQNQKSCARRAFLSGGLESNGDVPVYPASPLYFFFSKDRDHYCTEIILKNAKLLPKKM